MQTKVCVKCKKELFANTEYFYKRKDGKFGLHSWCIKCYGEHNKQQYKNKKGLILENRKKYRGSKNGREYIKSYYGTENYKVARLKYQQSEKGKEKAKETKKRFRNKHKLSCNISSSMSRSLKGNKVGLHWEKLVPYTLEDLRQHLESMFQSGMTWDNYGEWHVDHKIPISYFNFKNFEDVGFQECWSLDNLQPLWAKDNMRKSNKVCY